MRNKSNQHFPKSRIFREGVLPGNCVRLGIGSFAKIVGTNGDSSASDQLDRRQLLDVVNSQIHAWEDDPLGRIDEGLRQALKKNQIDVRTPRSITVKVGPLILRCDSCKILEFCTDSQEETVAKQLLARAEKSSYGIKCKSYGCNGHMRQVPYANIHRCGHMGALTAPNRHANKGVKIGLSNGRNFRDTFFVDIESGKNIQNLLQPHCHACEIAFGTNALGVNTQGVHLQDKNILYPQNVQYLAMGKDTAERIRTMIELSSSIHGPLSGIGRDVTEGAVSCLLGLIDSEGFTNEVERILNARDGKIDVSLISSELEKQRGNYKRLSDMMRETGQSDGEIETILSVYVEKICDMEKKIEGKDGAFESVRLLVKDDAILQGILGSRRTFESIYLSGETDQLRYEDLLGRCTSPMDQVGMKHIFNNLTNHYGVKEIRHLERLNVVLGTAGFSRQHSNPRYVSGEQVPVTFNGFKEEGRYQVYAMSAETEAVLVRLDPIAVLRWCRDGAGWNVPPEALASEPAARAFLLQTCEALWVNPVDTINHAGNFSLNELAPLRLLHSVSHALMAVAKRHSGYSQNSLMEYLFPGDLAFIHYVTSVENYTAGGLKSLFMHHLEAWFDEAQSHALGCVFDPICSEEGGACNGCLEIVLGCETFNIGLSRNYLHGGLVKAGDDSQYITQGFWS